MNKFYLCILLSIGITVNSSAQFEGLQQFTHSYFKSDPFLGQFSAFISHLTKDPAVSARQMRLRTDTSLFYFYGIYEKFNPFFFKPVKVEISLVESQVQYSDSLPPGDTLLLYQLTAYASPTAEGEKEVRKEFEKIHRQYKNRFFDSNYREIKNNGAVIGGIRNYFVPMHGVAPVTVAWGIMENSKQPVLNIEVRMKTQNNFAVLPVPLYHP